MYSLSIGPRLPCRSPPLEYGVIPDGFKLQIEPFAEGVICSPIKIALPSPSMVKCPRWWPAYAWAMGTDLQVCCCSAGTAPFSVS